MFPNAATLRVRCSPRDEYRRSSCIAASFGVDLQSLRSTNLIAISAIVLRCNTSRHVALLHDLARVGGVSGGNQRPPEGRLGAISAARPPDLFCDIDLSGAGGRGPARPGPARGPLTPQVVDVAPQPPLSTLRGAPCGDPLGGPCGPPDFWGALRSAFFDPPGDRSSPAPRDPRKVEKNRLQTPQKLQVSVGVGGLRPLT